MGVRVVREGRLSEKSLLSRAEILENCIFTRGYFDGHGA